MEGLVVRHGGGRGQEIPKRRDRRHEKVCPVKVCSNSACSEIKKVVRRRVKTFGSDFAPSQEIDGVRNYSNQAADE